jgi:two-component system phosphate regulon response regulator PhoB
MAVEEPPDLILLDFMMPVKSGFDVCLELAGNPSLRDVPVIVLTAFGQDIGVIHGLASGTIPSCIRDYVEKPFEVNVLLERVGLAMARKGDGDVSAAGGKQKASGVSRRPAPGKGR